jgi:hypothetical protein
VNAPPKLTVVFEIERAPFVVVDAANEPERARLEDWLRADGDRREVLTTLFEFLAQERTA